MNTIKEIRIEGTDLQGLIKQFEKAAQKIIEQTNIIKEAQKYPELMTQGQVQEYLQIHRNTVISLEKKRILHRIIIDGKVIRYDREEVMGLKNRKNK